MSLLRNKPKGNYIGLTIVMSNPSRFDKVWLLSANGGTLMNDALYPEFNSMQCDVRLADDNSPLLEGTKCILLLGEYAMRSWCPDTKGNTLNEMRGSLLTTKGLPAIASYLPQDAADVYQNHEARLNELCKEYTGNDSVSEDDEDEGDIKRYSATKRSNYTFWFKKDVAKVKQLLSKLSGTTLLRFLESIPKPIYKIYPTAQEVIDVLTKTKGQTFYFDMETDYEEQNLLCFAFSFDGITVYSVPILDYTYKPTYSHYHFILRALAVCIRDNTIVAHNGASFDFFVLGFKYHIPVKKCRDTMLQMQRCYPAVEKSLGHCVSLWTWERFHKDTDSQAYFTRDHMMDKLKYCAKDVYTMVLVDRAQLEYAKTIPGLQASFKCANDSINVYLLESLQGIGFDDSVRQEIIKKNDRLMAQYIRMINLLVGENGLAEIKTYLKTKPKSTLASGNKQQCAYFHNILGYEVLFRSPDTGQPSLGKKIMYRLALKHPENPVIPVILAYRDIAKETSALSFIPWKDEKGNIWKKQKEQNELMFP